MKFKRTILLSIILFIFICGFSISYGTQNKDDLNIYSNSVILIENTTGKVLYEKNSDKKAYPASTTKILTAILAIEKGNLNDNVTVTKSALAQMKPGYSSAYLVEGEILSVENLLQLLLVHSANDASNVLAEYISGSIEKFVDLMNEKLDEIGCKDSHFVTTNGLHDDNHYTTAKDMVTLARYCMQNKTFRDIVSKKSCSIPATNKSAQRIYKNTNDLLNPSSIYYYPNCIGIKTGYTSEARNCLVSASNKNGFQLIAVVLGADLTENKRSARYVDSKALYEYANSNYSFSTIAKVDEKIETIEIKNATKDTKSLDLVLQKDVSALVYNKDKEKINYEIKLNDDISAPIAKNTILGTVTYKIGDDTYTENLIASHDVEKDTTLITVLRIVFVLLLFIIILAVFIKIITNKNNK